MKLAFSTLGCPEYTVKEAVQKAVQYGYEGLSIRTLEGTTDVPNLPDFTDEQLYKTKSLFKENRIKLLCLSSGVKFDMPGEEKRRAQFDSGVTYTDLAAALEVPYVRIFGGSADGSMKDMALWIDRLADYGAEKGVKILLETHGGFSTAARVTELLSYTGSGNIGVIWDILHSLRHGEDYNDTWSLLKDKIENVHVKDAEQYSPAEEELTLCGEGKVPIPGIVEMMLGDDYDGFFEFEWEKAWHPELTGPEKALPHYIEYMRNL
jgi:sugar phosphate isomerase/epimerase